MINDIEKVNPQAVMNRPSQLSAVDACYCLVRATLSVEEIFFFIIWWAATASIIQCILKSEELPSIYINSIYVN